MFCATVRYSVILLYILNYLKLSVEPILMFPKIVREAAKKFLFLWPGHSEGGGGKGLATKKKVTFLKLEKIFFPKNCGH